MVGHGIVIDKNGKYAVYVQIQDGTEYCGSFNEENLARAAWVKNVQAYNGYTPKPYDVRLFSYSTDKIEMPNILTKQSVRKKNSMLFEIYQDRKKEWRWRLFSSNRKIIADSGESYKRIGACKKSIASIMKTVSAAEISESKIKKAKT